MDQDFFLSETSGANSQTLDFDKSPSVLLVFAANRFTRSTARLFQTDYGIGAMDWRMLVMLTKETDIPVSRASRIIGIDKAAVSRSLARLEKLQLAKASTPKGDSRRRIWKLTKKGRQLHDKILLVALQRQQQILKGFDNDDILKLNHYLQTMLENIITLDQAEQ